MKRIFSTLCLAAMVAFVATSCKKDDQNQSENQTAEYTISLAESHGFQPGPTTIEGSKAYLDPSNFQFRWNANDEVSVYNLFAEETQSTCTNYTTFEGGGTATARFSGPAILTKGEYGYFVFYNPNNSERTSGSNREVFHVNATQNYVAECGMDPNAMAMACVASGEAGQGVTHFQMEHIFGFLDVAIAGMNEGDKVNQIVVKDKTFNITGDMSLLMHKVNPNTLTALMNQCESTNGGDAYKQALAEYIGVLGYETDNKGNTITLNCGGKKLDYLAWNYFIIPVRPGAFYQGMEIDVYFEGGMVAHYESTGTNMNHLMKPGYFRNFYFLSNSDQLYFEN